MKTNLSRWRAHMIATAMRIKVCESIQIVIVRCKACIRALLDQLFTNTPSYSSPFVVCCSSSKLIDKYEWFWCARFKYKCCLRHFDCKCAWVLFHVIWCSESCAYTVTNRDESLGRWDVAAHLSQYCDDCDAPHICGFSCAIWSSDDFECIRYTKKRTRASILTVKCAQGVEELISHEFHT